MTVLLNVFLGTVPALIYGASLAAGIEDDVRHRRVLLLIYGLWAFTLAGWNWLQSSHPAWSALWGVAGLVMLICSRR